MKYKLIKKYPGSPELGFIISFRKDTNQYKKDKWNYTIHEIEDSPEFWKKIEPLSFKMGKWYKCDGDFMRYQDNDKDYGFCSGLWVVGGWILHDDWELADMNEVNELLLNKAQHDYPIGTKYKSNCCNKTFVATDLNISPYGHIIDKEIKIFNAYTGEWAEIIEKP